MKKALVFLVLSVIANCSSACDCGGWSKLIVRNPAGSVRYDNGSKIDWKCNQSFDFTNTYICQPNNESCQAKTSWEVKSATGLVVKAGTGNNQVNDGFTLQNAGVYTLTLNASCNGVSCKPFVYWIIVPPCTSVCDCGNWGLLNFNTGGGDINYQPGSKIQCPCNQPNTFSVFYQCIPGNENCQAKSTWEVKNEAGVLIKSGTGTTQLKDGFNLPSGGVYTLTFNASCNGVSCKPCVYYLLANCLSACECVGWGQLFVQDQTGSVRYNCFSQIQWKSNLPLNFTSTYQCTANNKSCVAKTNWVVRTTAGVVIKSGTGTNLLSDGFNLPSNGIYILTLNASCNGVLCKPCDYKIVIQ